MDELLSRQEIELKELSLTIKSMLKGVKKSSKAELEAKSIQMEFDLKAKHRDEVEELESNLGF